MSAHVAHFETKIWLVNETLLSISLQDLNDDFAVLYIINKWNNSPRQKKVEPQEYIKPMYSYKAILNKKSNAASKISNIKSVELMAELLEVIII